MDKVVPAILPTVFLAMGTLGAVGGALMVGAAVVEKEFPAPGIWLLVFAGCAFYLAGKVGG